MNHYNWFDIFVAFFFSVSPQIVSIRPKDYELVTSFQLIESELPPDLHLRALQSRSKIYLLNDNKCQKKNIAGIYIMEISKIKHLQHYMTYFEIYCITLGSNPQIYQLSIEPQWNKSLKPLKQNTFTWQQQVLPTWLNQFLIETLETYFNIIIIPTRATIHRNRKAIIINAYITSNPKNSHLHIWKDNVNVWT